MNTPMSRMLAIAAWLSASLAVSFAQGLLTPPGPPGPTMKTLQQVEPRTPIPSLPFTIAESGSYYLTTNLDGAAGPGIVVSNNNVTIDLMGFELAGGSGSAISLSGARSNIWIRNGTLRAWSAWGVNMALGYGCVLENLHVSRNGSSTLFGGVRLGSASVLRHCLADGNTGPGILVSGERNRIEANHLTLNDRGLLASGTNNVIIHNSALAYLVDYEVFPGNDLGPVGRADTLISPWGNIGMPLLYALTVSRTGSGSGTISSSPVGIN